MSKENKKVMVAGGAGYIGSKVVPALMERGDDVTVVDLLWFGNQLPDKVTVIKKDIFDLSEDDLTGFDIVIFLGGLSNDPMAEFSPGLNYVSNGGSPAYLAFLAKKAGVRKFIYGSSCSIYGYANEDEVDETYAANTQFPYGVSKFQGELGVQQMMDDSFSVISLRQGTLSGYSSRMRFDLFINTMYMKAATEKRITVHNPAIWRPVLSIEDAVRAYFTAIDSSPAISGVFNIASINRTVGDVAKEIQKHFSEVHGRTIEVDEQNIHDKRNYRVNTKKAEQVLGVEFREDVSSILADLDKNVGLDFDFTDENYYNIQVFNKIPKTTL